MFSVGKSVFVSRVEKQGLQQGVCAARLGSPLPTAQSACGSAGCLAKISLATNPVFCLSEAELPSVWDHQSRGVRLQDSALKELGSAVGPGLGAAFPPLALPDGSSWK